MILQKSPVANNKTYNMGTAYNNYNEKYKTYKFCMLRIIVTVKNNKIYNPAYNNCKKVTDNLEVLHIMIA